MKRVAKSIANPLAKAQFDSAAISGTVDQA
jgi:hypothetical protein